MEEHCEHCMFFKGYVGKKRHKCKYTDTDFPYPETTCSFYKPRKEQNMNIKEAYKVMQAAWVDLYDVKVGDTVRVLRSPKNNELGCICAGSRDYVGERKVVERICCDFIEAGPYWPFFCLEKIKSALHTIAFDGGEPEEVCGKCYEALKKALLKQQQARTRD